MITFRAARDNTQLSIYHDIASPSPHVTQPDHTLSPVLVETTVLPEGGAHQTGSSLIY